MSATTRKPSSRFHKTVFKNKFKLLSDKTARFPVPDNLPEVRGKEIPVRQNVANHNQKKPAAYKYSNSERPATDRYEAMQAVCGFKTLTIGNKQRANLARQRSFMKANRRVAKLSYRRNVQPESAFEIYEMEGKYKPDVIAQAQSEPTIEEPRSVMEVFLTRKPPITVPKAAERTDSEERESKEVQNVPYDGRREGEKMKAQVKGHIRFEPSEPKPAEKRSPSWNSENRPKTHSGIRLNAEAWADPDRIHMNEYEKMDEVFKNDGLHLDDNWQDRMVERYLFLKRQRENRQKSCAEKRESLMRDKKYKIMSHLPELTYSDAFAWYEDHNRLASYLLNSPLLTGERNLSDSEMLPKKPPATPVTGFVSPQREPHFPESRPMSVADTCYDTEAEDRETPAGYRLSFRQPSNAAFHFRRMSGRKSSLKSRCYSAPFRSSTPQAGSTTHRSDRSAKFMVDRPRSSASIPGKTRYMLVKDDSPKSPVPTPNKLEEGLLRRRFPAQHRAVVRAMKKMHVAHGEHPDVLSLRFSGDFSGQSMEHPIQSHLTEPNPLLSPDHSAPLHSKAPHEFDPQNDLKASGTSLKSKRSAPHPSTSTPIDSPPISVLHRKTCNYTPATFRA